MGQGQPQFMRLYFLVDTFIERERRSETGEEENVCGSFSLLSISLFLKCQSPSSRALAIIASFIPPFQVGGGISRFFLSLFSFGWHTQYLSAYTRSVCGLVESHTCTRTWDVQFNTSSERHGREVH